MSKTSNSDRVGVCWNCLTTFASAEYVYLHMNKEYGDIYDRGMMLWNSY